MDDEARALQPWIAMTADEFESLVRQAMETLPGKYLPFVKDVAVVIEQEPSEEVLEELGLDSPDELLGLYSGISHDKESFFDPGGHLPPRISIYRGPILRQCRTAEQVIQEVRDTVVHEIGHHFGLEDDEMPY